MSRAEALVIFAGSFWEESLASAFWAWVKYFQSDSLCEVTGFTTVDQAIFVEHGGPLLHGDEASIGGRYVVWSKFEKDERDAPYKVVPPSMMKEAIISWIGARVCRAPPIKIMNIIFCGHGFENGDLFFGEHFSLSAHEIIPDLHCLPNDSQLNFHLLSCYSGAFSQAILDSQIKNVYVHASSGVSEQASAFVSNSGRSRASLFSSAVLASLAYQPQTVLDHESRVANYMESVKARTTSGIAEHTPRLDVQPPTTLTAPVRGILHLPLSAFRWLLYLPNAAVQSVTRRRNTHPVHISQSTYSAAISYEYLQHQVVQKNLGYMSIQESGLESGVKRYLEGQMSQDLVKKLQTTLNKRRLHQNVVATLALAFVDAQLIPAILLAATPRTNVKSRKNVLANARALIKMFPDLESSQWIDHPAPFREPTIWLGTLVGLVTTSPSEEQTTRFLAAASETGLNIKAPWDPDCCFQVVESAGVVDVDKIFDNVLPGTPDDPYGVEWSQATALSLLPIVS